MGFEAGKQIGEWTLVSDVDTGLVAPLWVGDNGKHVVYVRNYRVRSVAVTQRLEKVASWAASFDNNHLLPIRKVLELPGGVAVVSAYEEGQPLSSLLGWARLARRPVPPAVAASLALDMLDGLHAMGGRLAPAWAHGGLRPEAVLVTRAGRARIMECGLTGVLAGVDPLASEAKWVGYAAPEQLNGRNVGAPADVFSAAAILWEMLVGRPLFEARDVPALKKKILEGAKERPDQAARAEVPKTLSVVVAQGLEVDAEDRYEAASAFANAVRSAVLEVAEQGEVAGYLESLQQVALDTRRRVLTEVTGRPAPTSLAPPKAKTTTVAPPRVGPTAPPPKIEVVAAPAAKPQSVMPKPAEAKLPSVMPKPAEAKLPSVMPKPPSELPRPHVSKPLSELPKAPAVAPRVPTVRAPLGSSTLPRPPAATAPLRSTPPPAAVAQTKPQEEAEVEIAPLSSPPDDAELDELFQESVAPSRVDAVAPPAIDQEAQSAEVVVEIGPPSEAGYSVVGLSDPGVSEAGYSVVGLSDPGESEPVTAEPPTAEPPTGEPAEPEEPPVEPPAAPSARPPAPSERPAAPSAPPAVTAVPVVSAGDPLVDDPIPILRPRRRWPWVFLGILIGCGGTLGVVYRAPHLLPVPPPRASAAAAPSASSAPAPRSTLPPVDSTMPEAPVIDEPFVDPDDEAPPPDGSAAPSSSSSPSPSPEREPEPAPSSAATEPAPKAPPRPRPAPAGSQDPYEL
jgi:hypothetical protein